MKSLSLSLAGRVAIATALTGALAAVLAAFVSWEIATELIDDAEHERLSAAAEIFLNDLDWRDAKVTLDDAIKEELVELQPASIHIAVYEGGRHIGGEPLAVPAHRCNESNQGGLIYRSCARTRGALTVVAGTTRASGAPSRFLLGAALASLAAAVVAAAIGQRIARWALAPLRELTQGLHRIGGEEPSAEALPSAGKVREVEVLRDALEALVNRLGDSVARARRFSADAAHELRTPLTVLSAQLDLLLEETPSGERRTGLLLFQLRVRTLYRLVERLLALATSQQGPLQGAEPVALEDVARQCVEALPDKERSRVALAIDAQAVTIGDESLLGVLVYNVLDNALKFSVSSQVIVRVSERTDEVQLDVIDEGPGIPEAERQRAFDAFFRAPSARAGGMPGHGIGLALVAQVTRQHGGSCSFLDTARGAHLRICLPAWQPGPRSPERSSD